jgi:ribosomal protein S18 acetylase RimI-like enzyme
VTASELADANLVEAVREHARWQTPCEVLERDGLLAVAGANAFPGAFRNCAVRTDRALAAVDALGRAREFFAQRGRGFTFVVRDSRDRDLDQTLLSAGIPCAGEAPCMVVEAPLAAARVPDGVRVERFGEVRHVADAIAVNAEAYEMIKLPAAETRLYFSRPDALLSPRVAGFVAYRRGRPVATALAILGGAAAGIYWVGIAAGQGRGGLGTLCTALATNAAFESGARAVTLQASPFGEALYRRLGYRDCDRMRRYRAAAPE